MSRPRRLVLLAAAGALLAAGCSRCRAHTSAADAAPSSGPRSELLTQPPALIEPLKWQSRDETRGIGLPAGCQIDLPIRHAELPAEDVRFSAARSETGELALALAAPGNPSVTRSGLLALTSSKVRALPWFELDRPPAFDRTSRGWVAAFTSAASDQQSRTVLWSEYENPSYLASGDQLAVADVLCHGTTCAVLTTLARAAAAPGATVHLGLPSGDTRIDVEADPAIAWQPLSITSFDGTEARIALKAPAAVAFWSVTQEGAKKLSELPTEFGAYDASTGKSPLVAAPGANVRDGCKGDQFPIRILGPSPKVSIVVSQAAPESLLIRTLDRGALLLWIAPIGCAKTGRTLVYASLVNREGVPAGSVMSVADATGVAAATRGSELGLWLRTGTGISFVRAHCGAPN